MKIILAPIELLGVFIKPFALMMRLYANIFAGHIVIYSILGLLFVFKSYIGGGLSFGLALVISILELLVAIFTSLYFSQCYLLCILVLQPKNTAKNTKIECLIN